jgi:hypothetical protein
MFAFDDLWRWRVEEGFYKVHDATNMIMLPWNAWKPSKNPSTVEKSR